MERVRSIIANRIVADGVRGAVVEIDPARQLLTMRLPGAHRPSGDAAKALSESGELRFRLVQGTIPYSSKDQISDEPNTTCRDGGAVTPDRPAQQVILPDKDKVACYLLGPTILTGRNIGSATAAQNSSGPWEVDVHFNDNEFVTKVAEPNVGKQVAIVVDGIVQSAPTIQGGITGENVTITGNFSSEEAHQLTTVLRFGALPIHLQFVSERAFTG
jgi:preprotein translocase subunit SecD